MGAHEDTSRPPGGGRKLVPSAGQVLRVLTGISNTSAMVFSVFLTVHLTSPVAAALGGGRLADKTLLIGRDLYLPLEPILVYAPLALHLASSATKRAILTYRTKRLPQVTVHLLSGYLLLPIVLPHILVHRILPQSASPPISSLSPSELGFDFVAYSLYSRPIESTLAYLALVGLAVPHAVLGSMKIVSWIKRVRGGQEKAVVQESPRREGIPRSRKSVAAGAWVGMMAVVAAGLFRLYGEGAAVRGVLAKRFEAVLVQTSWS